MRAYAEVRHHLLRSAQGHAERLITNIAQIVNKRGEQDLTRFDNLPTSSGQKWEDLIQYQKVYNEIHFTKDPIFIARERKPNYSEFGLNQNSTQNIIKIRVGFTNFAAEILKTLDQLSKVASPRATLSFSKAWRSFRTLCAWELVCLRAFENLKLRVAPFESLTISNTSTSVANAPFSELTQMTLKTLFFDLFPYSSPHLWKFFKSKPNTSNCQFQLSKRAAPWRLPTYPIPRGLSHT